MLCDVANSFSLLWRGGNSSIAFRNSGNSTKKVGKRGLRPYEYKARLAVVVISIKSKIL